MDIPQLEPAELVAPGRNVPIYKEILLPWEIPVHPQILKAGFPCSREFLEEVLRQTPGMVAEDIKALEQRLNTKIPVRLTPEGIFERYELLRNLLYKRIIIKSGSFAGFSYGAGEGIFISPTDYNIFDYNDDYLYRPYQKHPLPEEKAKAYAVPDKGDGLFLYGWQTHNLNYLAVQLFSRSFAVVFNNLGIERL